MLDNTQRQVKLIVGGLELTSRKIDVVKCRLNGGLYVRKSIDRVNAIRCSQASSFLFAFHFLMKYPAMLSSN